MGSNKEGAMGKAQKVNRTQGKHGPIRAGMHKGGRAHKGTGTSNKGQNLQEGNTRTTKGMGRRARKAMSRGQAGKNVSNWHNT